MGSVLEAEDSPRQPVLALLPPPAKQHHKEAAAQTIVLPAVTALSTEASSSQVKAQVQMTYTRPPLGSASCYKKQSFLYNSTSFMCF